MEKITNGFPKVRMALLLGAVDDLRDNFGSGKWWRSSAKKIAKEFPRKFWQNKFRRRASGYSKYMRVDNLRLDHCPTVKLNGWDIQ